MSQRRYQKFADMASDRAAVAARLMEKGRNSSVEYIADHYFRLAEAAAEDSDRLRGLAHATRTAYMAQHVAVKRHSKRS